jgi:hypothetical protein
VELINVPGNRDTNGLLHRLGGLMRLGFAPFGDGLKAEIFHSLTAMSTRLAFSLTPDEDSDDGF